MLESISIGKAVQMGIDKRVVVNYEHHNGDDKNGNVLWDYVYLETVNAFA